MNERRSRGAPRAREAPARPSLLSRWLEHLAALQLRKPWAFLALGALATLLGLWSCTHLGLRTRFEDLLPESSPSVIELRRLLSETEHGGQIYVLLDGAGRDSSRRSADALAESLRELSGQGVQGAASGVHEARRFLSPRIGLFASLPALEHVERTLREQRSWALGEALGLSLTDPPPAIDPEQLLRELAPPQTASLAARFPDGYYEAADGSGVVVVVDTRVPDGDLAQARALLRLVQQHTAALLAAPEYAGVRAHYAGNLVTGLAEYGAAARDLLDVGALGLGLVLAVVMLYFMRWRVLGLLALVVVAGLAWTFGLTTLIFGHINLASGALISLVAGSSVNHGIMFMARYFEERGQGADPPTAIRVSHATTGPATLTAALAGAAAYACLAAGDFPLLDHFAVVGALGMLLCWVSTTLLVGPALACLERRWPLGPRRFRVRYERPFLLLVGRWALPIAVGGALLSALGLVASVGYARVLPTEHDMRRLQNDLGDASELYAASRRCAAILGPALESSMLVLADSPDQVPALVRALEARRDEAAPDARPFEAVHSLQQLVPAEQERKLPLLASIRDSLLRSRPHLEPERWQRLAPLLPPADASAISLDTLPAAVAAPFSDRHGVRGRIVLIEPTAGQSDADLDYLLRWADAFRETRLPNGDVVRGSGRAVVFADMLRAVQDATPRTLALSLGLTTLVLASFFRGGRGTFVAFGALLAGLGWLGGLMNVADVKLNFMNFIALPVTFGIAVDYPVNFLARLRSERDGDVLAALGGSGGAIILCSATTLLGYGALLVSDNQAIRSLGLLCVMGELSCVIAATLVLPSIILSLQRWRARAPVPSASDGHEGVARELGSDEIGSSDTNLPRTRCREV